MRKLIWAGLFAVAGCLPDATRAADESPAHQSPLPHSLPAVGSKIDDFSARDVAGKTWSLAEDGRGKVVVLAFLGTECPLVKAYVY